MPQRRLVPLLLAATFTASACGSPSQADSVDNAAFRPVGAADPHGIDAGEPAEASAGGGGSGGASNDWPSTPGGSGGGDNTPPPTTTTLSLRTKLTGHYVTVAAGEVTAASGQVGPAQLLSLTDVNGGELVDGDEVQLQGSDGGWLSAVNGGGEALVTTLQAPGDFEAFMIVRLAGAGTVNTGDEIAFQAKQKLEYVSAVNGGGGEVRVDQPHAFSWETFTLTLDAAVTPPATDARSRVLSYLAGLAGTKTIAGQHDKYNSTPSSATDEVRDITGKYPGLWSADFGFGGDSVGNRGTMIAEARAQWQQGAVVQLMYHACAPTRDEYCSWDDVGGANPAHLSDAEWGELVTDGTALNSAWKQRLDVLTPYLTELKAAGIAPLFRPLHEMNQGVFWWGGRGGSNGTRRLFQLTHDYLVGAKGLDNLIWVWDIQDFSSLSTDVTEYDPGPAYYDIAALDVYGGGYTQDKYDLMKKAAGSKPIAIGECEYPPEPGLFATQPDWVFFMLWPDFVGENAAALPGLYADPRIITRDEMPGWN